jgi:hypothetical protein
LQTWDVTTKERSASEKGMYEYKVRKEELLTSSEETVGA